MLDRGFYVGELIDQLEKDEIPYVIRARLSQEMKSIYGIYSVWKAYDYAVAGWANTTLILGRSWKRNWGFLTNLKFKNWKEILPIYRKRWNIENIFKATDGIQLRQDYSLFACHLSPIIHGRKDTRNRRCLVTSSNCSRQYSNLSCEYVPTGTSSSSMILYGNSFNFKQPKGCPNDLCLTGNSYIIGEGNQSTKIIED